MLFLICSYVWAKNVFLFFKYIFMCVMLLTNCIVLSWHFSRELCKLVILKCGYNWSYQVQSGSSAVTSMKLIENFPSTV